MATCITKVALFVSCVVTSGNISLIASEGQIKRITVNLPPDIHLQLKLHAVAADTTINNCVLAAIKEHLQHECKTVDLAPDSALD